MGGEGEAPFALCCTLVGGNFSHPCSFHTEQRGLFLLLKRIIRKPEEYSIFSNFPLDRVVRSQSGVYFDNFGFQCVKSKATCLIPKAEVWP